jgi:pimeloyl-ACP methyl ester carboxylesterase
MREPVETFYSAGDVELCFETFGDPADPPLLLIMGLGAQMIAWHEEFCEQLAERGFYVVRFDNRDCGRSTRLDDRPAPSPSELVRRRIRNPAYTLVDMAADAVGLLDHLEIERAHIVGASMGGMIAQTLAARFPERVLSLVSIMSNTGRLADGQAALRLWPLMLKRPPAGRDAYVERLAHLFSLVGSTGFERDEQELRAMLELSFDRGAAYDGTMRQLGAIIATGSRVPWLRSITAPTLVIHGTVDRLVRPSGGRATARSIRGANLLMVRGMGHDLPRGVWPLLIGAIADNAARAGEPAPVAA